MNATTVERWVGVDGCRLWADSLGDPEHPCVLLVVGGGGQAIGWTDSFRALLVDGGRRVIRFDTRDAGLSTESNRPYTLDDLANDALEVLDAFGVDAAHVVGRSMGGMIGQLLAVSRSDRVVTLTSIMASPTHSWDPVLGAGDPDLLAAFGAPAPTDTREQRVALNLRNRRLVAGPGFAFDEDRQRELAANEVDRAWRPGAVAGHAEAMRSAPDRTAALADVGVPTLVIHGSDDRIMLLAHGVATARAIPGAELLVIDGMGHEIPLDAEPRIADAILSHTATRPVSR